MSRFAVLFLMAFHCVSFAEVLSAKYQCDEFNDKIRANLVRKCEWFGQVPYLLGQRLVPWGSVIKKTVDGREVQYCQHKAYYICVSPSKPNCAHELEMVEVLSKVFLHPKDAIERNLAMEELAKVQATPSCAAHAGTNLDQRFFGAPKGQSAAADKASR